MGFVGGIEVSAQARSSAKNALARIEEIFNAKSKSNKGDESDLLVFLVEKYEDEKCPMPEPDPIEAIRIMMEQNGY